MGLDLLIEFEFRTTRATGVLLGISSQKMDGLGIEMIDEKVSVSCLNMSDLFMILLFICRNSFEASQYSFLEESEIESFHPSGLPRFICVFNTFIL